MVGVKSSRRENGRLLPCRRKGPPGSGAQQTYPTTRVHNTLMVLTLNTLLRRVYAYTQATRTVHTRTQYADDTHHHANVYVCTLIPKRLALHIRVHNMLISSPLHKRVRVYAYTQAACPAHTRSQYAGDLHHYTYVYVCTLVRTLTTRYNAYVCTLTRTLTTRRVRAYADTHQAAEPIRKSSGRRSR